MADRRNVYWDANVFLHYVNGTAEHLPVLEALLRSSASPNGDVAIYTSALSKVEVSFGEVEKTQQRPIPEISARIDTLWSDPDAIQLVDLHEVIGQEATRLMRASLPQGGGLRPNDAIHLATAQWLCDTGVKIDELHTYDRRLMRHSGGVGFTLCAPHTAQLSFMPGAPGVGGEGRQLGK